MNIYLSLLRPWLVKIPEGLTEACRIIQFFQWQLLEYSFTSWNCMHCLLTETNVVYLFLCTIQICLRLLL